MIERILYAIGVKREKSSHPQVTFAPIAIEI